MLAEIPALIVIFLVTDAVILGLTVRSFHRDRLLF
jgi:hypothetical protein